LPREARQQRTSASECSQRKSPTARLRSSLKTAARSAITAHERKRVQTAPPLLAGAVSAAGVGAGAAALLDALAELLAGAVAADFEVVAGDAEALGEFGG